MNPSPIHYQTCGIGKKHLLCFHGFGQDKNAFLAYSELLPDHKLYLFDLFYHGKSNREEKTLSQEEWTFEIDRFLKKENIIRFSMLSFSLGGRFTIATFMHFYSRIDQIFLLAPDGLLKPMWYRIATSWIGNPIFKILMNTPKTFEKTLSLLEKTHLASSTLVRFARNELPTHERRIQVYRTWTYFKTLQVSIEQFGELSKVFGGEIHVILGEKDAILPESKMKNKLAGKIQCSIHSISAKHHQMISSSKSLVSSLLKGGNL
jgi:pimeloyl-ACP methyl ester carboxylesterase